MDIQINDKVKLLIGGPVMIVVKYQWKPVTGIYDKNRVWCTWFVEDQENEDLFSIDSLEKV